ncbi:MAG: hypothetical protein DVB25_00560 [Verrucomicrobia bacterium]|nr:MAG: hypothetical protein DVB25_00560 [Verrucomicrobiota bacterium]
MNTYLITSVAALVVTIGPLRGAEALVKTVERPDTSQPCNAYYGGNRQPLLPSPLVSLPFGSIKPQGWLRTQLELERDGFTGHLTEISQFCNPQGNAWLDKDGLGNNGWEEVPYWFRGFAALAYVLDDKELVKQAQPWIESMIASQTEFGYFGTQANLFAPIHPPVPAELLSTPDGKPGLRGEYFADVELKDLKATRVDAAVDFDWAEQPPMEGMPNKQWSARWTGFVTVKKTGDYTFSACTDDGARLWVNGEALIDNWKFQAPLTVCATKPIHLEAGKRYPLRFEFLQLGGGAVARLSWKMPGVIYKPGFLAPDFMPNMSMLFALRSYYEYSGDKRIIGLMTRYFAWQLSVPDNKFFAGGWQFPRNGDNMDSVYWLYNITGDNKLLDLTAKLMRTGAPWTGGKVEGGHNVDYSQGFRKPGQFYIQSKDPKHLAAAYGNYDSLHDIYGQVPGGMFGGDEFARPGYTDPQNAIETCGSVDMMLSQQMLLRITGDLTWADRCENIAFNTLPASFTADGKALRYLTSPNQVNSDKRSKYPILADAGDMQAMDPYNHRCCQHNSGMGWPYFAQNLWQATPGNGLCAVMYAPNRIAAKVGDGTTVNIVEDTHYPFDGAVNFAFTTPKAVHFPLYVRIPGWCDAPVITLNGKPLKIEAKPKSLVMIERVWANGDKLAIQLPMDVKVKTWAKQKNAVSVDRGPLTFSVKIAEKYLPYRTEQKRKWAAWEILAGSPWNYGLVIAQADPAKSFKVVTKPWPADNQPFKWDQAPIELLAQAKKIPNWTENYWGTIDALQTSPIKSSAALETISMIPMGAGRLRVSQLPRIGDGPEAKEWAAFQEPIASATHPAMPMSAMWDGLVPKASNDKSVPHFSWWPQSNSTEYVIWKFDKAKTISQSEVYWFIDEDGTTTPVSWKLYYKAGDKWLECKNSSPYGLEKDKFNVVNFATVTTTAIKLEAKLGGRSGGISEWKVN